MSDDIYRALADMVLTLHVGVVLFVVGGLVATLLGGAMRWRWVSNRWFRAAHLACIVIIVMQSWLGVVCPLTDLEMWLRVKGGQRAYDESFMAHWLGRLLFIEAPPWAFVLAYTAFGAAVLASLWLVPVRWVGEVTPRDDKKV